MLYGLNKNIHIRTFKCMSHHSTIKYFNFSGNFVCLFGLICGATPPSPKSRMAVCQKSIAHFYPSRIRLVLSQFRFDLQLVCHLLFSLKNFFINVVFLSYCVPLESSMVISFPFLDTTAYGTGLNVVVSLSVFSCLIRTWSPTSSCEFFTPRRKASFFLFFQHHDPLSLGHCASWYNQAVFLGFSD